MGNEFVKQSDGEEEGTPTKAQDFLCTVEPLDDCVALGQHAVEGSED